MEAKAKRASAEGRATDRDFKQFDNVKDLRDVGEPQVQSHSNWLTQEVSDPELVRVYGAHRAILRTEKAIGLRMKPGSGMQAPVLWFPLSETVQLRMEGEPRRTSSERAASVVIPRWLASKMELI